MHLELIRKLDNVFTEFGALQLQPSTIFFNEAKPWANCPPTILSQFMIKPINLPIKLLVPHIVHVTVVTVPSGLKANSAVLVAVMGFKNSNLNLMKPSGWLSIIVMLPTPTLLFPDQCMIAPVPVWGPSKVFVASGSSFAQGDQASHCFRSLTRTKMVAAGAAIFSERLIRKSEGCRATIIRSNPIATTMRIRMILNITNAPGKR